MLTTSRKILDHAPCAPFQLSSRRASRPAFSLQRPVRLRCHPEQRAPAILPSPCRHRPPHRKYCIPVFVPYRPSLPPSGGYSHTIFVSDGCLPCARMRQKRTPEIYFSTSSQADGSRLKSDSDIFLGTFQMRKQKPPRPGEVFCLMFRFFYFRTFIKRKISGLVEPIIIIAIIMSAENACICFTYNLFPVRQFVKRYRQSGGKPTEKR